MSASLTYKSAGVDVEKTNLIKKHIKKITNFSCRKNGLQDLGSFASLFLFPKDKYKNPVLVASSDGVGTKLKIAQLVGIHNTVGIDLVAMNVNDVLCLGAKPLFFLDYISYAELSQSTILSIIQGIKKGCMLSSCELIGGEMAQMPDMYREGEYDLAGFCVGVVEKERIVDGSYIKEEDLILGLASSGLHSNGFSLVRKVLNKKEQIEFAKQLLIPTRIYVKPVLELLSENFFWIKGIAHITGGSFYNKLSKILPKNVDAVLEKKRWSVPKIFRFIQDKGKIDEEEMYRTFNMGIGLVLVVDKKGIEKIIKKIDSFKIKNFLIGSIVKGSGNVILV